MTFKYYIHSDNINKELRINVLRITNYDQHLLFLGHAGVCPGIGIIFICVSQRGKEPPKGLLTSVYISTP